MQLSFFSIHLRHKVICKSDTTYMKFSPQETERKEKENEKNRVREHAGLPKGKN